MSLDLIPNSPPLSLLFFASSRWLHFNQAGSLYDSQAVLVVVGETAGRTRRRCIRLLGIRRRALFRERAGDVGKAEWDLFWDLPEMP